MNKRIIALAAVAIMLVSLVAVAVAAKCNHRYEWVVTEDSTCYRYGKKHNICQKCGDDLGLRNVPKKDHNFSSTADHSLGWRAPTCQQAGYEKFKCLNSGCPESQTKTLPRVNHNFKFVKNTTQPTCTSTGKAEYKCEWCPMHDYRVLSKLPHALGAWKVTKAATKTSTGTKTRKCNNCSYTETQTIPKLK